MNREYPLRALLGRAVGFLLLPVLSMLIPLAVLPMVARTVDPAGWATIGVATAIGTIGSTLVQFGWGLYGPKEVASDRTPDWRRGLYRVSLGSRLLVALPVCAASAGTSLVASEASWRGLGALLSIGGSLCGLSPAWYFIGIGSARLLLVVETMPRVVIMLVGGLATRSMGIPIIYGIAVLLAGLIPPIAGSAIVLRGSSARFRISTLLVQSASALKRQWALALSNICGSVYSSSPMVICSIVASVAQVASFGSLDKVYRMGLSVIVALANATQGWVFEAGTPDVDRRRRWGIMAHGALGAGGLLFLGVLGSWTAAFLYGARLSAPMSWFWMLGGGFLCVSLSTALIRLVLVPRGEYSRPLVGTSVAAVVGLVLMFGLGGYCGGIGVALGFAFSELVNVLILLAFVRHPAHAVESANTTDRNCEGAGSDLS